MKLLISLALIGFITGCASGPLKKMQPCGGMTFAERDLGSGVEFKPSKVVYIKEDGSLCKG